MRGHSIEIDVGKSPLTVTSLPQFVCDTTEWQYDMKAPKRIGGEGTRPDTMFSNAQLQNAQSRLDEFSSSL